MTQGRYCAPTGSRGNHDAPMRSLKNFSEENYFFLYEAPPCATSPPGDGAHRDTQRFRFMRNCVISCRGYTSISHDGDAKAAGACLHAPKSLRVLKCFLQSKKNHKKEGISMRILPAFQVSGSGIRYSENPSNS